MYRLLKDLRENKFVLSTYAFGDVHHVTIDPSVKKGEKAFSKADLESYLNDKNHEEVEIAPIKASIEDCFMQMIA